MIFPSYGSLLQLTTEVAGLGGNVGYLKNDVFIQQNYSLIEDFVSCFVVRIDLVVIIVILGVASYFCRWYYERYKQRYEIKHV